MAEIIILRERRPPEDPRAPELLVRCADWDQLVRPLPEGAVKLGCEWCARPCWCDVQLYPEWTLTAADPETRRPILCTKCGIGPLPIGERSH